MDKRIFQFILIAALASSFSPGERTRMETKALEALQYCTDNGLNSKYCILIDMSIHSGKDRLFVHQFSNDSTLSSGLCSHGCCDKEWGADDTKTEPVFSNVSESHCSSIGKFKVGERGYSNWGINVNYKLHGLDTTNNEALSRLIVLHSWDMVPENELYPEGTPEGWGCPAVSNKQMKYLDSLLKKSTEPVLLWIYK